jgi:hypothetical protein
MLQPQPEMRKFLNKCSIAPWRAIRGTLSNEGMSLITPTAKPTIGKIAKITRANIYPRVKDDREAKKIVTQTIMDQITVRSVLSVILPITHPYCATSHSSMKPQPTKKVTNVLMVKPDAS